jgi:putative transposase
LSAVSDYIRRYAQGGWYFFTVVTWNRKPLFAEPERIDLLRCAVASVRRERPFAIDAMVALPDHIHAVWRLPDEDADFSTRWQRIKRHVSIRLPHQADERGEKKVWQPRFWEHLLRDETDWRNHIDYIHFNPVKHAYAGAPAEWPHSTFPRCVRKGWYAPDWGRTAESVSEAVLQMEAE